jgi:integrase
LVELPRVGEVRAGPGAHEPFVVVDEREDVIEPVGQWVRDLVVNDLSPRTVRAYTYALLTWFRALWLLEIDWERATESDAAALVGWLRTARNPQRHRRADSVPAGSVNIKTGKPVLGEGYRPSTINLVLAAVHGFYAFHGYWGRGPVVNPVPGSPQRRRALMHRSPTEHLVPFRRARFRQKATDVLPRSIPDACWSELVAVMSCDRDRALLESFVSSGARAAELLGVLIDDVDWAGQRVWVVSKGTRVRRIAPLSPTALFWLTRYVDADGVPPPGQALWRTRRGAQRPLTYLALRRMLQRANDQLGTNWSLHDLRHTAAARMVSSGALTLPEVQVVLGHADLRTTSRYTLPRVEELCDRLQEFYARPGAAPRRFAPGYDPDDLVAVFGGAAGAIGVGGGAR